MVTTIKKEWRRQWNNNDNDSENNDSNRANNIVYGCDIDNAEDR